MGIPHSEFLDWSSDDRAKAIAFVYEDAAHCDLCGTAEWEWDEDKRAYAPLENFCMGCYIKTVYSDSIDSAPGVTVQLTPTGTIDHAKRLVSEKRKAAMTRNAG